MLYRLFPWDPAAGPSSYGGALFNPRLQQGSGRHDNPSLYGALYAATLEVSAVAEWLAAFRGQRLGPDDFRRSDGHVWGLVGLDDGGIPGLVDLDDPDELVARSLRPSAVATHARSATRDVARGLFAEGLPGFRWWSTIEASWSNATLFAERVQRTIRVAEGPREIDIDDPAVRLAAAAIGVLLA